MDHIDAGSAYREQARHNLAHVRGMMERYPEMADDLRALESLHLGIAEGTHQPRPCQRPECIEARHTAGNRAAATQLADLRLSTALGLTPADTYEEARARLGTVLDLACWAIKQTVGSLSDGGADMAAISAEILRDAQADRLTAADLPAAQPETLAVLAREGDELHVESAA